MHFYEFFIGKIPISNLLSTYQILFNLVSQSLLYLNNLKNSDEHINELTFISNLIVFELYFKDETRSSLNDILLEKFSKTYKINQPIEKKFIIDFLDFINTSEIKKQISLITQNQYFHKTTNFMFKNITNFD